MLLKCLECCPAHSSTVVSVWKGSRQALPTAWCRSAVGAWGRRLRDAARGTCGPQRPGAAIKKEGRRLHLGQSIWLPALSLHSSSRPVAALVFKLCSHAGTEAKFKKYLPGGGEVQGLLFNYHTHMVSLGWGSGSAKPGLH